jgi:phosphoribosylanthranilate isomerase
VQLHGDTTPQEAVQVRQQLPYIKAYKVIHVFDGTAIQQAQQYAGGVVDGIILDTAIKETGQIGGTGKTHDWDVSAKIVGSMRLPVILAGGLNPDNVIQAIRRVHPYAVDVNSGLSNKDGTKDHQKLKLFIEKAKSL